MIRSFMCPLFNVNLQIAKRRIPYIFLQFDTILIGETANIRDKASDQQHVAGQLFNLKLKSVKFKINFRNYSDFDENSLNFCHTFRPIDAIVSPPSPVR